MSRKHFEALATALKTTKPVGSEVSLRVEQWIADVAAVAAALKQLNPQFDTERFITLCE